MTNNDFTSCLTTPVICGEITTRIHLPGALLLFDDTFLSSSSEKLLSSPRWKPSSAAKLSIRRLTARPLDWSTETSQTLNRLKEMEENSFSTFSKNCPHFFRLNVRTCEHHLYRMSLLTQQEKTSVKCANNCECSCFCVYLSKSGSPSAAVIITVLRLGLGWPVSSPLKVKKKKIND